MAHYVIYLGRRARGLLASRFDTWREAREFADGLHPSRGAKIAVEAAAQATSTDPYMSAPYVRGSTTSQAAAESIQRHAGALREQVYTYINEQGGATDDEVQVALRMLHQTQTARRRELVQANRIVDSGLQRRTRSGRMAKVWIVSLREGL